ncbi:hypothetical protein NDU88_004000 [Pleurodeles waltl]|uniref:Uncharacterized protein n=1 Tax=Pleurodeles waltl TaxID=8319 RepID=A0AAV7QDL2_PLEWA|nr:hypothetical protein NDU88_004000 [Pleurodeles waltl]
MTACFACPPITSPPLQFSATFEAVRALRRSGARAWAQRTAQHEGGRSSDAAVPRSRPAPASPAEPNYIQVGAP